MSSTTTTIIVIVAVIALILRTVIRYKFLSKQVDKLNKILYTDRNPNGYVEELDKILSKQKNKHDKDINLLQKATGLFYAGRFDEAKHVLNVEMKQIPANGQHLFYQNLILSMLFNGEIEEGHKALIDATEVLTSIKKTANNKFAIEFLFAVDDLYQGKYEERKDFFLDLCENGRNYYRKAMANYCVALIYKNENNLEEMNKHLELAKEIGQNSFVEKLVLSK
ncbi:hypothetical protein JYG23_14375 [Sedimentibacter sp. zth1]|uniref:hypothetical protein n=1 Tax=Sedimentibacter sp. zth1 TaxID=2816908 RepID=UPI001A90D26B|nr:hypothetical protein [Sedimentibacter sp. zth1]QSX05830.1 hypothetical protein JYG23_14375 [Sedimentibacter sp. zth1]